MESLNEIQSNHHIISTFEMNLVFLICDFFLLFSYYHVFLDSFCSFLLRGCLGCCGVSWTLRGESSTFPVWNCSAGCTVWLHQHPSVRTSSARRCCTRTRYLCLRTCFAAFFSFTYLHFYLFMTCYSLLAHHANAPDGRCDKLSK